MGSGLSADEALATVAVIASVGVMILALEDRATRHDFRADGLMSWETRRLASAHQRGRLFAAALDAVFASRRVHLLIGARLAAAAIVAGAAASGTLVPLPILAVFASLVAMTVRSPYGLDGAHQMYIVVFGSLSLAALASSSGLAGTAAAAFIGAQSLLAYFVSGVFKATSPVWRSGDALIGIMATESYGHPAVFSLLLRRPRLAQAACWAVILLECAFPLAAWLGTSYLWVFLAAGVIFHALNALVMGLNGFLFAFLSTYPAVLFVSETWGASPLLGR